MPFTPTHALAAVPLSRLRALDPAALAIGSMLPDLPMFLPATPQYATTHDFRLGPLSCLPYGVLAFVLFRLCRGPAIALGPASMRARLAAYVPPRLSLSAAGWASVLISLVLGVWSHIVWDSFTHANRFGAHVLPEIMTPWLTLFGVELRGYEVLQLGCSALGLPILAWVIARWYARQPKHDVAPEGASFTRRALWLALLVSAPLGAIVVTFARVQRSDPDFLRTIVYELLTLTLSAYLIGTVLLTLPRAQR